MTPEIVAIVGPTAAGKSDLAIRIAEQIGGEVVNADSMQLYRGMDIGTAKLSPAHRRGITHHLLDVFDVTESVTVADYQRMARTVIEEIRDRNLPAVLVGGSGLYVRAALDTLEFPGTDPAIRARLEAELDEAGPLPLHDRLAAADPAAAASILAANGRRVVRALEVIELTGRPFAATLPSYTYARPSVQMGIEVPRDVLDARIADRVERMWAQGLVDEVRRLVDLGLRAGRTASRALGYAQVLRHLDGECTESEARHETVRATRRFARRQDSWFRRDPRVRWLPFDAPDLDAEVADLLDAPLRPIGPA